MNRRKTLAKVIGGVLVSGMLLTAGVAFAADDTGATNVPGAIAGKFFKGGRGEAFKTTLDKLAKDGVISQKKADDIKAYIDKRTTIYDELVQNKILTQKEADTLETKMKETVTKEKQQLISDGLAALVKKGTITQAQADKIVKKYQEIEKEREALFEKTKDMTWEERRQYMQDNKAKFTDTLSQLVTDKVITEDQADAIRETVHFGRGGHKGGFGGKGGFRGGFKGGF